MTPESARRKSRMKPTKAALRAASISSPPTGKPPRPSVRMPAQLFGRVTKDAVDETRSVSYVICNIVQAHYAARDAKNGGKK